MSLIELAESIDALVEAGQAHLTEGEAMALVSTLSAADVANLRSRCQDLAWTSSMSDSVGNLWPETEPPDPDFAPFRLSIEKPDASGDTLQILSNRTFERFLRDGHDASHWQIAGLTGTIITESRVFQPWGGERFSLQPESAKSPRLLVREFSDRRRVPEDVRPWLAKPLDEALFSNPAAQAWVRAATASLVYALPDEIGSLDGTLNFFGPPRLTLPPITTSKSFCKWTVFNTLQAASHWVFENEREAEMRHILLATELARSGAADENTLAFLSVHLNDALESAQIAYQMTLAHTSRDTLITLSDLRKAVTDEAAKLTELSRQLSTAVAGALATGIGLVAARVTAHAPATLVAALMTVVAVYVVMVIASGYQFIRLQRHLRAEWRPKLYRFLPPKDYSRLVAEPAKRAERVFICTALIGGVAILALGFVCVWPFWNATPDTERIVPSSEPQAIDPIAAPPTDRGKTITRESPG